jgi:hypothetical protein
MVLSLFVRWGLFANVLPLGATLRKGGFPGLLSCWVTMLAFGQALGAYELPLLYCIGCTLLEGFFCLGKLILVIPNPRLPYAIFSVGMIWKMDPFQMPRAFCIGLHVRRSVQRRPTMIFSHSAVDIYWLRVLSYYRSRCCNFDRHELYCAKAENMGRSRKIVRMSRPLCPLEILHDLVPSYGEISTFC